MIRTYVQLQDAVLGYLDEASDQDVTRTLVKQVLNEAHRHRIASRAWPHMLWGAAETFSTAVSTRLYALHHLFSRPLYFYNRTTNRYLSEIPMRALPESDALYTGNTGDAETFFFSGVTPVQKQPVTAGTLSIVSSSAADTTAGKAITIKGVTTAGAFLSESLTPTGTTAATTTASFTTILSCSLTAAWAGTCTLTDSGAVTLLTLGAGETARQYRQIYLGESPTAVQTIEYRFFRQPLELSNDHDVPELPGDVMDILIWDTLLLMAGYIDDIQPASLQEWRAQQARWEFTMEQILREGQSLESSIRYVRDTDDAYWTDNRRRLWAN